MNCECNPNLPASKRCNETWARCQPSIDAAMSSRTVGFPAPVKKKESPSVYMNSELDDPRVAKTNLLVEADNFAQFALWSMFSDESTFQSKDYDKVSWKADTIGRMVQVGTIDGKPIMCQFFWATINDIEVCFYFAGSSSVDHKQVRSFIDKTFSHLDNGQKTDAMNFGSALYENKDLTKSKD